MVDVAALWDFSDPAASEQRFRDATRDASPRDRLVLATQVARALGLQDRFDEGHAVLDELGADDPGAGELGVDDPEVPVRVHLERGRLLRSGGDAAAAAPEFAAAAELAGSASLDALRVDALHMVALVAPEEEQTAATLAALAVARASADQAARDWDASLLNNLGMSHADAGRWDDALTAFAEALVARERIGRRDDIRIARWMIGWSLRNLGRTDEALATQLALKADLDSTGDTDSYVDEELALLG